MQRDDGSLWIADRHEQALSAHHISQGDSNDCGPHVVTMAVNFWHGRDMLRADDVAKEMNRPQIRPRFPLVAIRRIPNWATFPWGIADMLRTHGLDADWKLRAHEEDIRAALHADRIVMPIFGEPLRRDGWKWDGWSHVALLVGWDPRGEVYWFVDSSHRGAPTSRPAEKFRALWGNMGRILITAG